MVWFKRKSEQGNRGVQTADDRAGGRFPGQPITTSPAATTAPLPTVPTAASPIDVQAPNGNGGKPAKGPSLRARLGAKLGRGKKKVEDRIGLELSPLAFGALCAGALVAGVLTGGTSHVVLGAAAGFLPLLPPSVRPNHKKPEAVDDPGPAKAAPIDPGLARLHRLIGGAAVVLTGCGATLGAFLIPEATSDPAVRATGSLALAALILMLLGAVSIYLARYGGKPDLRPPI